MGTITGMIFWNPDVLKNTPYPPGGPSWTSSGIFQQTTPLNTLEVGVSFNITANRFIPPVGFGSFGSTEMVAFGKVTSANEFERLSSSGGHFTVTRSCSASYEIDGLPINEQLFVEILAKAPPFTGGNDGVSANPLGSSGFITLTSQSQSQPGPSFSLQQLNIF